MPIGNRKLRCLWSLVVTLNGWVFKRKFIQQNSNELPQYCSVSQQKMHYL
jgi:hypothetical protein